jgi:uncharacterized protein (DUF1810 family)
MTPAGSVFERLLEKYFQGVGDARTLERLDARPGPGAGT